MAPAGILRGKVASFTLLSLRNLKRTPTPAPAPAPAMSLVMATNGEQPEFTSKKFKFGSEGEAVEVSMPGLKVKKLSENATIPTRGSSLAAGYDLYSAYDIVIGRMGKALVKTDVAVALPEGCYGRVAPRSSLSWKHHIDVGAGVIDRDYRGNVGVVLFNLSGEDYEVKKGDRIAQLVLERIFTPPIEEVEELPSSDRGSGGFGSTGR